MLSLEVALLRKRELGGCGVSLPISLHDPLVSNKFEEQQNSARSFFFTNQ